MSLQVLADLIVDGAERPARLDRLEAGKRLNKLDLQVSGLTVLDRRL